MNRRKEIMLRNEEKVLTRGFLFACTSDTEEECFNRMLFATEKAYGPIVIRIRKGDLLFLNNIDADVMYGVFRAVSDGVFKVESGIFNKKYPYQVRIECLGDKIKVIILKYDKENERVSLGHKQITEDPWENISQYLPFWRWIQLYRGRSW